MTLEDRLKDQLRPVDPGEDFTARVLARVAAEKPAATAPVAGLPPALRRLSAAPRWALAASVLLAVGAGVLLHGHLQRERSASSARQLALALELTSHQLQHLHQRLDRTLPE